MHGGGAAGQVTRAALVRGAAPGPQLRSQNLVAPASTRKGKRAAERTRRLRPAADCTGRGGASWPVQMSRHLTRFTKTPRTPMRRNRFPNSRWQTHGHAFQEPGKRAKNRVAPTAGGRQSMSDGWRMGGLRVLLRPRRPTQCHRTAHFLPDRLAVASRNGVNG